MLLQLAEDVEVALLVGIHAGGGVEHAEEVAHAAVGLLAVFRQLDESTLRTVGGAGVHQFNHQVVLRLQVGQNLRQPQRGDGCLEHGALADGLKPLLHLRRFFSPDFVDFCQLKFCILIIY